MILNKKQEAILPMAEKTQLDKFEALKAMTQEPTSTDKDKSEGRAKASQQWISHYIVVSDIKTAWSKDPENKDKVFTAKLAEQLLVEHWNAKEEVKQSVGI